MKKIYIVTGANGFLGNNIIRRLEKDSNNEIRAFVLKNDSIKSLENLRCKIYYGDITKKESLTPIFKNINNYDLTSFSDFYSETGVEIGWGWYSYIISFFIFITYLNYIIKNNIFKVFCSYGR